VTTQANPAAGDGGARQNISNDQNDAASSATDRQSTQVDPRIAFLERAAARLLPVRSCDLDLTEAIAGLREAFEDIIGHRLLCPCVTLRRPIPTRRRAA
jgi:hypothetical protein